jgi:Tol biopolymer transport system component
MHPILLALALSPGADPTDWNAEETKYLSNIKQVTKDFVRAGEGYFSPDGKKIIYQAEERDTGNPFYQIFVQELDTGKFWKVSPGNGRTTCAYFRPDGQRIIFASSHEDPDTKKHQEAEYRQREADAKAGIRRRYSWDFDPHMKIYEADLDGGNRKCLTPDAKVYTAEGSFSRDGKKIVYSSGNAGDVQLYIMDADGKNPKQLTTAKNCYNGGPFLSPDGTKVIFRSDRKEKDRLQLYVVNADGTGEKALTNNDKWVYWAPYWYQDGKHIIYTAADHSDSMARPNYDLYWMNIETGKTTRITHAPGQDVLPVFSPDYKKVMWTSSRDGRSPTQLWIADFTPPKE